jgi:hypothetical protein
MISYADGTDMKVGDSVLIEEGQTPGIIHDLIESAKDMRNWNVNEAGAMIESAPFGLVFLPVSTLGDDPIIFVSRK